MGRWTRDLVERRVTIDCTAASRRDRVDDGSSYGVCQRTQCDAAAGSAPPFVPIPAASGWSPSTMTAHRRVDGVTAVSPR